MGVRRLNPLREIGAPMLIVAIAIVAFVIVVNAIPPDKTWRNKDKQDN